MAVGETEEDSFCLEILKVKHYAQCELLLQYMKFV